MDIISYKNGTVPKNILEQIENAPWSGAASLARLLKTDSFVEKLGPKADLLVLQDGERLAGFCTLADHDDVPDTDLRPWIGYVYVSEQDRGKGLAPKLISYAEDLAKTNDETAVYISTGHRGLYEKYGYELFTELPNKHDQLSGIYRKTL